MTPPPRRFTSPLRGGRHWPSRHSRPGGAALARRPLASGVTHPGGKAASDGGRPAARDAHGDPGGNPRLGRAVAAVARHPGGNSRAPAGAGGWILTGALDWARLILREDARSNQNSGNPDHLGEPWAMPLEEARLSSFLAADRDNSADQELPAFLSGEVRDLQSRLNFTQPRPHGGRGGDREDRDLRNRPAGLQPPLPTAGPA